VSPSASTDADFELRYVGLSFGDVDDDIGHADAPSGGGAAPVPLASAPPFAYGGPMPSAPLRVALAQSSPVPGDVGANVRAAAGIVADAASRGAHLVVFPELFLTGYELPHLLATPDAWLRERDARLDPVRRACADADLGVTAVLGAPVRTAAGAGTIAAPVVGPRGDVGVSYKEHLHGSEETVFRPGLPIPPFEANGWRVSIGICFDVSHPSHAEHASRAGADLYVATSLYWRGEERRMDLHFGARAMDNRVFTAVANYAGTTGGHVSCGLSGAWGPSGEVLARASGAEEELVVVELDPAALVRYRA
jgi:predicted amidohydrolase